MTEEHQGLPDGQLGQGPHSAIGASSAERWFNCPGSVALSSGAPDRDDSEFAKEGKIAHEVAAKALLEDAELWEYIGETFQDPDPDDPETVYEITVDADMADYVSVYVDWCREKEAELAGDSYQYVRYVEQRIDLKHLDDRAFGTVDFGLVGGDTMIVNDLKYGAGIFVEAIGNKQVRYYAAGLYFGLPIPIRKQIKRVLIVVSQPRIENEDGLVRVWEITAQELVTWAEGPLKDAMARTRDPKAPLKPGEWCRFCPAAEGCPALKRLYDDVLDKRDRLMGEVHDSLDFRPWTDEELSSIMVEGDPLRHFLKACGAEAYRRMMQGAAIADHKIVLNRANRVFKKGWETAAVVKFGRGIFKETTVSFEGLKPIVMRALKTPAQLAKLNSVAKAFVAEWAYKPMTGFTIVKATDKRPGVIRDPAKVFANVGKKR